MRGRRWRSRSVFDYSGTGRGQKSASRGGDDPDFYLRKGFRVVAIDADKSLKYKMSQHRVASDGGIV
jgi:hypothetical protein